MNRAAKYQLIAAVVIAIIVALAAWYAAAPRQQYSKYSTLTGISFQPPPPASACAPPRACAAPLPIFTFTFSRPLAAEDVDGTIASLKGFTISPATDPVTAAAAGRLYDALLQDGGVPFAPVLASATTITSNSMPAALAAARVLRPLSFAGSGAMWFAKKRAL